MSALRTVRALVGLTAIAFAVMASPALALDNCPGAPTYPWMGSYQSQSVTIPGANGVPLLGTVFAPGETVTYPGLRPMVLVLHGFSGNECGLWWFARDLAGHGYVVLTFTERDYNMPDYVADGHAALAWLRSSSNPYLSVSDTSRLGIAGHSEGSIATELLQETEPATKAIVAFDNLRAYENGDPGDALFCTGTSSPITPKVPAEGQSSDLQCGSDPTNTGPTVKQSGWSAWRAAGLPTENLVINGSRHVDWAAPGSARADENELHLFSYYAQAWFDDYLLGNSSAQSLLLSNSPLGEPIGQALSSKFWSAVYVPGVIDCNNLVSCI
jgi:hypothetical protein